MPANLEILNAPVTGMKDLALRFSEEMLWSVVENVLTHRALVYLADFYQFVLCAFPIILRFILETM